MAVIAMRWSDRQELEAVGRELLVVLEEESVRGVGYAELLTFLADWLSGSQRQTLTHSLTAYVGHPACDVDNLAADLHRFIFLHSLNDGEQVFGEPTPCSTRPMINIPRLTGSPV